jgi:hypothetical protein
MKRFFFCLLILFPVLCSAQTNFQPGFVVKNDGDTLKGFINYTERFNNPKAITFRRTPGDSNQIFVTRDISALKINNLVAYQRFVVDISMGKFDVGKVARTQDTTFLRDTVLLEILEEGRYVSLYSYRDNIKKRFYLKENNIDKPVELIKEQHIDPEKESSVIVNNKFIGQLFEIYNKYNPEVKIDVNQFRKSRYVSEDLIGLTALINGAEVVKSKYSSVRFFAGAGLNASKTYYAGTHLLASPTASQNISYLPTLTTGLDFFLNPAIGRLLLRGELSFFANKHEISNETKEYGAVRLRHKFSQLTASFAPQIIYHIYNADALKGFIGAGIGLNFSKFSNNSYDYLDDQNKRLDFAREGGTFDSFYYGFQFSTGIVLNKKLEITVKYSPSTNLTSYFDYNIKIQRYSLGLNYLFGKH